MTKTFTSGVSATKLEYPADASRPDVSVTSCGRVDLVGMRAAAAIAADASGKSKRSGRGKRLGWAEAEGAATAPHAGDWAAMPALDGAAPGSGAYGGRKETAAGRAGRADGVVGAGGARKMLLMSAREAVNISGDPEGRGPRYSAAKASASIGENMGGEEDWFSERASPAAERTGADGGVSRSWSMYCMAVGGEKLGEGEERRRPGVIDWGTVRT